MALAMLCTMATPAFAATAGTGVGTMNASNGRVDEVCALMGADRVVLAASSTVKVPLVANGEYTLADARNKLNMKGLAVEVAPGGSELDTAKVINQSPEPGERVPSGTTITLTTEPDEHVITNIYLGYQDPTTEEYIRYPEPSLGQIPLITTKGGSIDLIASVLWKGGDKNGTAQDATELDVGTIEWSSLTPEVAEVEPWTGKVTALADGEAIIQCELKDKYRDPLQPDGVISTIAVRIIGQTGPYVADVSVINELGQVYGADPIPIYSFDGATFMQFYVRAIYTDGVNVEERTTVPQPADPSQVIEGFPYADSENPVDVTWTVSSSEIGFVNEDTGNFRPLRDGTVQVIASIAGGINGPVTDYATVSINTGTFENGAPPAEELTVHVGYSNALPQEEIGSFKFTKDELIGIASASQSGVLRAPYTMLSNAGTYMTLVGEGITLRALLDQIGVAIADIEMISFAATDGVNNAEVAMSRLYTSSGNAKGYYFPYCGTSGLEYGKQLVEPMLAINSYSYTITSNEDEDLNEIYKLMDGQNCFRFCFGVTDREDFNANRNIYKITDLYVELMPPSVDNDPEDQEGEEPPPESPDEPKDPEDPDDSGDGGEKGPGTDGPGGSNDEGPGGDEADGPGGDDSDGDGANGEKPGNDLPGNGQGDSGDPSPPSAPNDPGSQAPSEPNTGSQQPQQQQSQQQPQQQQQQPNQNQQQTDQLPPATAAVTPQQQIETPLVVTGPTDATADSSVDESSASGSPASSGGEDAEVEEQIEETEESPEQQSRWQLYEMMNKSESDLDIEYSNPLEPFFLPGTIGVIAVGGVVANQRFRRELRPI